MLTENAAAHAEQIPIEPPVARHPSRHRGWPQWATTLLVFLLSLVPRAVAQGRFITVDEIYHWFERSQLFLQAIRSGDYVDTFQVGHPGVTTMWLGAAGVATHNLLTSLGWAAKNDPDLHRALLRLPVAIVTSLCIALAYPLLRQLFERRVALLAVLLWAADPFLVAHSKLLHVDALLTSFMSLSILAALAAFYTNEQDPHLRPINWGLLCASAVAGGLALLTKSPSVMLPPLIGLIAIGSSGALLRAGGDFTAAQRWRAIIARWLLPSLFWACVALIVWFVLWPAAWVNLPMVIDRIIHQAESDGGSPHGWGNFFLGHAVADPGPLFYPVALVLRLPPWTLIGLLAAAAAARNGQARSERRMLGWLALFALLFMLMMSIPPKKFDRYILPIFPALNTIAAFGLLGLGDWLRGQIASVRLPQSSFFGSLRSYGVWTTITLLLAANLAWYHPYEIAYYNPLLGGGPIAAQTIPIGWGEGYELAGDYIMAQPDGRERPIASWFVPVLRPYVQPPVVAMAKVLEPGQVGYAVLYIDQLQRRNVPQAIDWLQSQLTPIHTVRIHGIDYAYIYQIPQPVAQPLAADFGTAIHFRGYAVDTAAVRSSGAITLTLYWQAHAPADQDYVLFAHVLAANGTRFGQADVPPGGPTAPTSSWQPNRYVTMTQRIPVQADMPPGDYWITIGLYSPHDFHRLPLQIAALPAAPADGVHALPLGPITIK